LTQYHSCNIYHHIPYEFFESPAVSSVPLLYHRAPFTVCCHTWLLVAFSRATVRTLHTSAALIQFCIRFCKLRRSQGLY